MRITNNMMVNTLMNNLARNLNRMSIYQDRLATGKQVIRASDDPVATSKILKFKSDIAALGQYEKNTGDSLAWLEVTESSIADTGNVLQRMRELAVQAANGTNTKEETQKIAMEIEQMKAHLINNGNFSYAGRYAFSGYQTYTPLFNADGSYKIDVTQTEIDLATRPKLQYQVSIAQEMDVSTNGLDVFGYVLGTDAMATHFTNGAATGTGSTQAGVNGTLDFTYDFSAAPGNITFTIDGTNYVAASADVAALNGSVLPITKEQVLNLINNAKDASVPPVSLSSAANAYFDQNDKLVLSSKSYGAASTVQITYANPGQATAFGLPVGPVAGTATGAATVTASTPAQDMDDAYIAAHLAEIEGSHFYVTLNGERQSVTIGTLATPDQAGLTAALNTALNGVFPPAGTIQASFAGNSLQFTTSASLPGQAPQLEIRPIVATQSQMMVDIDTFIHGLKNYDNAEISGFLTNVDTHLNQVLAVRADIGARVNRMELIANRISDNTISFTKMLSDSQDADMGGVIMYLKNAENVYKAALSTGSKVIQPSLVDFLR